ncbi:MAG: flippase-like domain-containing protein [Gemmatimonadota bacterium]|nr:flippase-like domain-containing protein [Gemmatimonadota bacterium]
MKRPSLGFVLKATLSVLLLADVFRRVRWQELWEAVREIDLLLLILYVALGSAGLVVSAAKWLLLARSLHVQASLPQLLSLYMIGNLFNQVLPTKVGGDAVRAYELGKSSGRTQESIASVFMDRATGFALMVLMVLVGLAFDSRAVHDPAVALAVAVAIGGCTALVALVLAPSLLDVVVRWLPAIVARGLATAVTAFQNSIEAYRQQPAVLLAGLGYSFLFYATTVIAIYTGCLAFNVRPSLASLAVAVPVVLTVSAVPISLAGFGLREWAYAQVLGLVGVPAAVGLSLALLARARGLVFGLIGYLCYPLVGRTSQPGEAGSRAAAEASDSAETPVVR